MLRIRTLTLAVVAACALSVAVVASASAQPLFHASSTGKLLGKALNNQKFKTNGGTVECTSAKTTGEVTVLLALTQLVNVEYSGCTAFGLAATISTAHYLFDASGFATVDNTILINVPSVGCMVTVGPSGNGQLKTIKFVNNSGKLKEETEVTGITYTTTGGICGTGGSNGTYTGNSEVELDGGTISWG